MKQQEAMETEGDPVGEGVRGGGVGGCRSEVLVGGCSWVRRGEISPRAV